MIKRLCIYETYDKQNIVDNYIGVMLKELKDCMNFLVVVCNETHVDRGIEILKQYADMIFFRENIGFDAGAFKDVLCNLLGWEKVLAFDELFLVNDSFFGPFVEMKDILIEMEGRNLDFWGLIDHAEAINSNLEYIPAHIQSFFLCIDSVMLHDIAFKEYWNQMPYYKKIDDVVKNHEMVFTQYFVKMGYSYGVYAYTACNNSSNIKNNFIQYMVLSNELIRKRKFPFLKKQQIAYNTLNQQTQENLRQAFDYIDKNTNYDIDLIWENIIRTLDMKSLQHSLSLRLIVSDMPVRRVYNKRIIVIIFASYLNAYEYIMNYIDKLLKLYEVIVYTKNKEVFDCYRNKKVRVKEGKFRIENFCKIYQYICILHDEDMSSQLNPSYIAKSYFYGVWDNLIKDEHYVNNIVSEFENNKRLGFLYPPKPIFADYFSADYGLKEKGSFWIRGSLLNEYNEKFTINDWIKKVQYLGFYSEIVESVEFARMNEQNQQYYLEKLIEQIKGQYKNFFNFEDMKQIIFSGAVKEFCSKYKEIFIYGIGYMARNYKSIIPKIDGYVISDNQENPMKIEGIPVFYLSELKAEDDIGIIICVSEKYQKEIIELLKKKGHKNFICI